MENLYCRFCAETKDSAELLHLDSDEKKCNEIEIKLSLINAMYVDVLSSDVLPKTVCFVCYDSLNNAYDFFYKVQKAQNKLKHITKNFPPDDSESSKLDLMDDDRATLEEFFGGTHDEEIKVETSPDKPQQESLIREIKLEPNEETSDSSSHDVEVKVETSPEKPQQESLISEIILEPNEETSDSSSHDVDVKEDTSPEKPQQESLISEIILEHNEETSGSSLIQETYMNIQVADNICESFTLHDILDSTLKEEMFVNKVKDSQRRIKSWKDFVWACAFCIMDFADIDTFRVHCIELHNQCAAFSCTECKTFTRTDGFEAFVKHVQRKHRKGLRDRCHYCDAALSLDEIDEHVKQHFKGKFVCPSCGQIHQNEESLQTHLALNAKQKNLTAEVRQRRKPGTPITEEELTCQLCKRVYKNFSSLKNHMKRHTSEQDRNYTCDRCGKSFFNKGTLTTHVMAHDRIRPYICRICKKSFAFPNKLKRHVEMHSGVKPFSCEICGRTFRLKCQLKRHKIIHTDAKPYVCQYCNKAFRFKQVMVNHERQHTGIKPYSCEHCGKVFTNWSNYNKHMKRRHNFNAAKKKITPNGTLPINPETGQVIKVDMASKDMDEWKSKILSPGKRGKKKRVTVK